MVLVTFAGAALRLYQITRGFWVDEVLTHRIATQSLGYAATAVYYPLSYVFVHWSLLLGDTEFLLRLPSLIAGLCLIPLMFLCARRLYGDFAAVVSALLVATSPYLVPFSQDGRFYSIMPLASLLALWFLVSALESGKLWHWVGYTAAIAAGGLNHPFFILYGAALWGGAFVAISSGIIYPREKRKSQLLWLFVCTIIAFLPALVCFANYTIGKHQLVELVHAGGMKPARIYRLGVIQYLLFFPEYLVWGPQYTVPAELGFFGIMALAISFLLLLAGAARLWKQQKPVALLLFAVAFLQPLPLFFLDAGHWYASKYFVAQVPQLILLVGGGIRVLYDVLQRAAPRMAGARATKMTGAACCLFLLLLAPESYKRLRNYYGTNAREFSWKDCASLMSSHMSGRDTVVHFNPPELDDSRGQDRSFEQSPKMLTFYLDRMVNSSRRDLIPGEQVLMTSEREMMDWLSAHPMQTCWFVVYNQDKALRLMGAGATLLDSIDSGWSKHLMVVGAPTGNLVRNGAIDEGPIWTLHSERPRFEESRRKPFGICVNLSAKTRAEAAVYSFPLKHPHAMVRNGKLDAWQDGKPVGWNFGSELQVLRVQTQKDERQENKRNVYARLTSTSQTGCMRQMVRVPAAPGDAIGVSAWVRSDAGVFSVLATSDSGSSKSIAAYSGSGAWEQVAGHIFCTAADPEVLVEVICPASTKVEVDDLHVEAGNGGWLLLRDSHRLSALVKYENVAGDNHTTGAACVRLVGKKETGEKIAIDLGYFFGSRDWHTEVFSIEPETHPELFSATEMFVQFRMDGAGTMWVDNVQLEAGSQVTPFTREIRLPHDEAIANLLK